MIDNPESRQWRREQFTKAVAKLREIQGMLDSGDAQISHSWFKTEIKKKDPSADNGACVEFKIDCDVEVIGMLEKPKPPIEVKLLGPVARYPEDSKEVNELDSTHADGSITDTQPTSSSSSSSDGQSSGISKASSNGKTVEQSTSGVETPTEVNHTHEGCDPPTNLVEQNNVTLATIPQKTPAIRIVIKKSLLPNIKGDIELILTGIQELADGGKGIIADSEFLPSNLNWINKLPDKGRHPVFERHGIQVRNVELVPIMRVKNGTTLQNRQNISH